MNNQNWRIKDQESTTRDRRSRIKNEESKNEGSRMNDQGWMNKDEELKIKKQE